jgi:hypothetical protein
MSFNPHAVANMARLAPNIPRGITTAAYDYEGWAPLSPERCDELREIADYDRVGASFISHEAADLARPRVAALKAKGAAILTWTIKSAKDEAKAREIAVRGGWMDWPDAGITETTITNGDFDNHPIVQAIYATLQEA